MDSGKRKRIRILGKILFILYVIFIVYFLLFSDWYGRTGEMREYHYNLVLFKEIKRFKVYFVNKEEKAKLWSDRIQQYQTSGQTCKQWCTENGIPLSTMGYWIRRFAKEEPASESEQDMVFVRLPSEQEAAL